MGGRRSPIGCSKIMSPRDMRMGGALERMGGALERRHGGNESDKSQSGSLVLIDLCP